MSTNSVPDAMTTQATNMCWYIFNAVNGVRLGVTLEGSMPTHIHDCAGNTLIFNRSDDNNPDQIGHFGATISLFKDTNNEQ